ncbi:hypothetical protein CPLU01_04633 [Colletotrichum plurivorum]|uniref:Uncharacterized protein n=1 Tax=Colletotrichum plurivorum TaxID=2175906 RepID=A0A8H6KQA2_9PEZI|nr:hypothetical protein CPLU01_04633 [Colletotrichum plurivorum]
MNLDAALGAALAIPSPRYGYACLAQAAARPGDPPGSFQFADRRLQSTSASWHRLAEGRGTDVRDGHSKTGGLVKSAIEYALVSPPDGVELLSWPAVVISSKQRQIGGRAKNGDGGFPQPQPFRQAYDFILRVMSQIQRGSSPPELTILSPAAYESPDEEPFPSLSQLGANCTEPQPLPYAYGMSTPPNRHRNARPSDAEHPQPRESQQDEI